MFPAVSVLRKAQGINSQALRNISEHISEMQKFNAKAQIMKKHGELVESA